MELIILERFCSVLGILSFLLFLGHAHNSTASNSTTIQNANIRNATIQNSTIQFSTIRNSIVQNSTDLDLSISRGYLPNAERSQRRCPAYGPISNIITRFSNHLVTIMDGQGNLFFSPFSMSVALAMVYLGARGETASSMEVGLSYNILDPSELPDKLHELFKETLDSLDLATDAYSLEVANGMFIQEGFLVSARFVNDLQKFYTANLYSVDFKSNGDTAASDINEWTSNHTSGQIKTLLNEPLDPMTVLLLANAIYFKGSWKYPFNEKLTRPHEFYSRNSTTLVPFMEYKKRLLTFKDDSINYTFLEMDYQGDDVSMIFALPYDRNQFPTIEITASLMCRVRSNFRLTRVRAMIPKFNLAYERELSRDLYHLGLSDLFSESRANLTGIRYENDLFVSGMIHKAVIEVNEEGSVASAVTGVSFNARSGNSRFTLFRADHPFLFCILEKRSGTILFLGRVVDL